MAFEQWLWLRASTLCCHSRYNIVLTMVMSEIIIVHDDDADDDDALLKCQLHAAWDHCHIKQFLANVLKMKRLMHHRFGCEGRVSKRPFVRPTNLGTIKAGNEPQTEDFYPTAWLDHTLHSLGHRVCANVPMCQCATDQDNKTQQSPAKPWRDADN